MSLSSLCSHMCNQMQFALIFIICTRHHIAFSRVSRLLSAIWAPYPGLWSGVEISALLSLDPCQTRQYRVNDNILYRVKSFNISDTSSSQSLNLQNYFSTSRQKSYVKPIVHTSFTCFRTCCNAAYSWAIYVPILNDAANQKQEKNKLLTKTSIVTVLVDHSCTAEQYSRLDWY